MSTAFCLALTEDHQEFSATAWVQDFGGTWDATENWGHLYKGMTEPGGE